MEGYVHGSEKRLIRAAWGGKLDNLEAAAKEKRLQDLEEKALHAKNLKQTKDVRSKQSSVWLQNGDLKRRTESLLAAAQNQSNKNKLS